MGDYDTLVSIGKRANRLMVVDFFATWCGPCQSLGAKIPEIAKAFPDVLFVKVDIDACGELANKYSVRSVPTIKFMKANDSGLNDLGTVMGPDVEGIKQKINSLK